MDYVALLKRFYQEFNIRKFDNVLNLLDSNIIWREAVGTDQEVVLKGSSQIKEHVIDQITLLWDNFHVTPIEFIQANDIIVVIVIYDVQEKLSNKKLQTGAAHIWKLKENKIIEHDSFINTVSEVE